MTEQNAPQAQFGHITTIPEPQAPAPVATSSQSVFDLLKSEAEKELGKRVRFDVDARPGFQIEVETLVAYRDFKRYQTAAQKGSKDATKADAGLLAGLLLADYTKAILHHGKELVDEEGDKITFRSEGFINSFGASTAAEAVTKFLSDGHMLSLSNKVLELAGYGSEVVEVEDPSND